LARGRQAYQTKPKLRMPPLKNLGVGLWGMSFIVERETAQTVS